ncbi:MAG: phage integrase N-terminal SAM-like domain-containing protein [Burkholderiales bacterium]|nr:phage integrase N-terminal SAM-like domain-containing protein [Burkholderiales bacterium]
MHEEMRRRGYSQRTEKSYWYWIRGYIRHHGLRHPAQMDAAEVEAYRSWLAAGRNVAAATQNQALAALLSSTSACRDRSGRGSRTSFVPSAPFTGRWCSRVGRSSGCLPGSTA